jgi:hypothetical protein
VRINGAMALRETLALPVGRSKPKKQAKKSPSEKRLLELGRKHFSEDFPNPKRQGCQPAKQLKLLAESPRKAKDSVLNHISSCSLCYRADSRFVQKMRLSSRVTK